MKGTRIFESTRFIDGFTLNELDKAGVTAQEIILHNIPTDLNREQNYDTNAELLRIWKKYGFIHVTKGQREESEGLTQLRQTVEKINSDKTCPMVVLGF